MRSQLRAHPNKELGTLPAEFSPASLPSASTEEQDRLIGERKQQHFDLALSKAAASPFIAAMYLRSMKDSRDLSEQGSAIEGLSTRLKDYGEGLKKILTTSSETSERGRVLGFLKEQRKQVAYSVKEAGFSSEDIKPYVQELRRFAAETVELQDQLKSAMKTSTSWSDFFTNVSAMRQKLRDNILALGEPPKMALKRADRCLTELTHYDQAKRELVEGHIKDIVAIAKQYRNKGLSLEERISAGAEGSLKAAKEYDPQKHGEFRRYAAPFISEEIKQASKQQEQWQRESRETVPLFIDCPDGGIKARAVAERREEGPLSAFSTLSPEERGELVRELMTRAALEGKDWLIVANQFGLVELRGVEHQAGKRPTLAAIAQHFRITAESVRQRADQSLARLVVAGRRYWEGFRGSDT